MTGVKMPAGITTRGRNFLPLLERKSLPWNNDFYGEYSQHHYTEAHLRMYRTPQWKLIRDFKNQGKDELCNLSADPGETRNLINDAASQQMKKKLETKILAKMKELRDPVFKG
jgi:uncharacterized sulfatase